eukprot:CAMPEP_0172801618 /NCGR_PEP_ID=MMETSP1075-20121228/3319_1 /TAXON_ID=2916 /ORGANISM="Ceratium fusus, Strain PA161109" /LENGTH=32 /DNA_ID= /DNA_START= /DNA_END= /DNA_ORIENTATION=
MRGWRTAARWVRPVGQSVSPAAALAAAVTLNF